MSTLVESCGEIKRPGLWLAVGAAILLVWGAIAFPALHRERAPSVAPRTEPIAEFDSAAPAMARPSSMAREPEKMRVQSMAAPEADKAAADQKIIRTGSLNLIVQHPTESADMIATLAESSGGYVETSESAGPDSTSARLTIRVPSSNFEAVRSAIRKLGIRVDGENIDAQDVTRQYVDQDASIRNLMAEEAQYLAILKQAHTVKDMLAVTENLSAVRGEIEQQHAEFNALSRKVETVALTVSLRSVPQEQTFVLNWHPGDQLKTALHDGLESLATYASAMIAILSYLPVTLLWVGTIAMVTLLGWRTVRWTRRRFGSAA